MSAFDGGRSKGKESFEEIDGIGSGVSAFDGGRSIVVGGASLVSKTLRERYCWRESGGRLDCIIVVGALNGCWGWSFIDRG